MEDHKKASATHNGMSPAGSHTASIGEQMKTNEPNVFKFAGVEMSAAQVAKMSDDPAVVKAVESVARRDEADKTAERTAPALDKLSTLVTQMLAKTQLTPADLSRLRFGVGDDGKAYAEIRTATRSRNGAPSERFGGFTQSVLKAHNVKRFVQLGKHGKMLAEASDGAGICTVESIPFAGQAKHDADANHASAGCDTKTCTVANHGDNADRLTYAQRGKLAENGWHVEHNDGKRAKLDTLDWDTTPSA